ncbi:uncharacterized protein LOC115443435 isoform X1 [Manduca sexta]|uniref:uncharacterized protein LOC115443435 isoform X1 n=1 Tax=Manduca sexta TaxID=7130 RepID=UPI00188F8CCB|nr:uncharacterized protein LOC115443435 isoform X1 [Manduca sexta]
MTSFKKFLLLCSAVIASGANLKKMSSPPHCTHVSKDTDYLSKFKFTYPTVYIPPGQREAYQQMFCLNPAAVNKAVTTVCDWAAPPQVEFTLGDEYVHVVRQDPSGRYNGNVVITTYQLCSHNRTYIPKDELAPTVTDLL